MLKIVNKNSCLYFGHMRALCYMGIESMCESMFILESMNEWWLVLLYYTIRWRGRLWMMSFIDRGDCEW